MYSLRKHHVGLDALRRTVPELLENLRSVAVMKRLELCQKHLLHEVGAGDSDNSLASLEPPVNSAILPTPARVNIPGIPPAQLRQVASEDAGRRSREAPQLPPLAQVQPVGNGLSSIYENHVQRSQLPTRQHSSTHSNQTYGRIMNSRRRQRHRRRKIPKRALPLSSRAPLRGV